MLCEGAAAISDVILSLKTPHYSYELEVKIISRILWAQAVRSFSSRYWSFSALSAPVKLPTKQCPSIRKLELKQTKGRISTMAPRFLAKPTRSLRPILHVPCPGTTRSCSKGSRGLSVPSRVPGIFTGTTISPSSWLRQYPDRYTIRAGRNLPDKEFRYLRTVIVTAAVYRGFNSKLLLR